MKILVFLTFSLGISQLALATGAMEMSKSDIEIVLAAYKDNEGAIIKKIERIDNGLYNVEVVTKLKKCHASKVKIDRKKKKALFDPVVKICD